MFDDHRESQTAVSACVGAGAAVCATFCLAYFLLTSSLKQNFYFVQFLLDEWKYPCYTFG